MIAKIKGSEFPDQWIIRGNHHDGWVEGATDPLAGQVALLDEAKAFGELMKTGWRPKRTIIYASWDGEEPGLLGSTEWAETHAAEIKKHAVLYINTDSNARGMLYVGGNHDLEHFVNAVAEDVTDPETKVSVAQRRRAKLRVDAMAPGAKPEDKEEAKRAADPKTGHADRSAGLGLGLFGVPGTSGREHHRAWLWRRRQFRRRLSFALRHLRASQQIRRSRICLWRGAVQDRGPAGDARRRQRPAACSAHGNFASAVSRYLKEIQKLETDKRKAAEIQNKALKDNVFALAADPTESMAIPPPSSRCRRST